MRLPDGIFTHTFIYLTCERKSGQNCSLLFELCKHKENITKHVAGTSRALRMLSEGGSEGRDVNKATPLPQIDIKPGRYEKALLGYNIPLREPPSVVHHLLHPLITSTPFRTCL
jgi:hypothetical protein